MRQGGRKLCSTVALLRGTKTKREAQSRRKIRGREEKRKRVREKGWEEGRDEESWVQSSKKRKRMNGERKERNKGERKRRCRWDTEGSSIGWTWLVLHNTDLHYRDGDTYTIIWFQYQYYVVLVCVAWL